jgi:hypothetical protein
MNKKYAVFGVAAVIAVAGVIYFGTSANQQASVANVANKLSGPVIPIDEPTTPSTPVMTEFQWRKLCRDGKPHIRVMSPNGGEVYQADQMVNLKWKSCNLSQDARINGGLLENIPGSGNMSDVRIQFSNNASWSNNVTNNDGGEVFRISPAPMNGPLFGGKIYKIYLTVQDSNPSITDESDNTFTINTPDPWVALCADGQPHIQVISPNGGEVYQVGQQVTVKWRTCNDNSDSSVSAILTTNQSSNNRLLGHSPADINTATFTIPSTLSGLNNTTVPIVSGQHYKINLELRTNFGTNDLMASDNSNNTFTINEITGLSTTLASALNPVSTVSSTSGAVTSVLYRIRLNVTANRSDFYIPRGATFIKGANNATVPSLVSPQNGISFGILNESNLYVDGATAGRIATPATEVSSSVSIVSGASVDPSGRIKIPQGQTAVLDLAVIISEGVTPQDVVGQYKVGVLSVNGATNPTGAISNFNTTPVVNYQTQFNSPAFQ